MASISLLLFEAITLPSILSQSDQNFTWFIVSDRNLPSQYKQRLRDLASTYQNIENLEVDFYCQYREIVETGIKARIKNHQQAIAISHIDDDDAWHITTIQQYRQRIKRKQYRQLLKAFQR